MELARHVYARADRQMNHCVRRSNLDAISQRLTEIPNAAAEPCMSGRPLVKACTPRVILTPSVTRDSALKNFVEAW